MDKQQAEGAREAMSRATMLEVAQAQSFINTVIELTPTGPKREKYTEAHIHLMQAAQSLREAAAAPVHNET